MKAAKNLLVTICVLIFFPTRPVAATDLTTIGTVIFAATVCTSVIAAVGVGINDAIHTRRFNRRHDENAKALGKRHLGYGIYFDGPTFFVAFSADEQILLRSPDVHALEKARFLSAQLQGDYDNGKRHEDYAEGVDATFFLKGHGEKRGVCRHKSVVMVAALNALGIEATYTRSTGHAWVTLVKERIAFDPTTGAEKEAKKYSREVGERELGETLSNISWM